MPDIASVLALLDVELDAFAVCEVQDGWALQVEPLDKIVVHFVLRGRGSIESEHGLLPIKAPMMIVVPKCLPKLIKGEGPVRHIVPSSDSCPLTDEIERFQACQDEADLLIGCGAIDASAGGTSLFENLQAPLAVSAKDAALPFLFEAVLAELSRPSVGSKAIIEAVMKQILIILLRSHFTDAGAQSPICLMLRHPELGRAVVAMTSSPHAPHTVASLAALVGMSRSRFSYHFTKAYGRSPMEFLQSIRLKQAARLLQSRGMLVKSICAAVGFESRSHFSRAFRTEYGIDPTAYREQFAAWESRDSEAPAADAAPAAAHEGYSKAAE